MTGARRRGPRCARPGWPHDARAEALSPAGLRSRIRPAGRDARPGREDSGVILRAPAKLNLCLLLGPPRDDGLHELCSLFEALIARPTASSSPRRSADEVVCAGVEGTEPRRDRARGAARTRLGRARRCGSRSRSGSRSPRGSAAAAPTPRPCCGSPRDEVDGVERARRRSSAPTSRRSSTRASRSSRAPASASSRSRRRASTRFVLIPGADGLSDRRRLRRGRPARARPRPRRDSRQLARAAARCRRRRVPRRSTIAELLVNDLERGGPLAAARDRRGARRAARGRRRARARHGLGADRVRALRRHRRRRPRPPRRCRRATRARSSPPRTSYPMTSALSSLRDHRVRLPLIAAAIVGGYFLLKRVLPDIDLQQLLEDVSDDARRLDLPARRRRSRSWRPARSSGLVAPGETFVILAGAVAGQGDDVALRDDRDRLGVGVGRRLGELPARPAASAASFMLRHGRRVRITPERFAQVEGYFEPPRRQDDPDRALHRPRARAGAVHRRQLGDALPRSSSRTASSARACGRRRFTLIGYFASQSLDRAAEFAGRGTFLFGDLRSS